MGWSSEQSSRILKVGICLKNMKLAHLSKETRTVEVAMGCGALGKHKKWYFLGIFPKPVGGHLLTFGQKKSGF